MEEKEINSTKPLENINIAEVCRACFETCEEYKNLFEESECIDNRTLGDVFFDVVKIEIKTNAETPPCRICLSCSNDLINAYNFIQKSQKNNGRLLKYLRNANIKKPDCLTEFPMDIPNDQNVADFLQIKVENEAINDYYDSIPDDDRNSPEINNDSDESDYEPLINKKEKIKKLQCTYCDRIFKRQDFFENHLKKHKDEVVKKKEKEQSEDGAKFNCDECSFSCSSKIEMKKHMKSDHTTSVNKDLNSSVNVETEQNNLELSNKTPNLGEDIIPNEAQPKEISNQENNKPNNSDETNSSVKTNDVGEEKEKNIEGECNTKELPNEKSGKRLKRMAYQKILFDQKKTFISLYEEGKTVKEAAEKTNINLNTAKAILCNYKKRSDLIVKRCGGNRARKLTTEVLSSIEACVEKNPGIHLERIRNILTDQKIHLSRSSIRNGLQELRITMSYPSHELAQVNLPQAIERRRIFALEFTEWGLHDRHKMIFVDECVFNLQLGKINTAPNSVVQGRKAVVIAALNSNGLLHWKVFGKGSCNTTEFGGFIRELVDIISVQYELTGSVLIMDSAGIHESREVGEMLAISKFCTRTLPPFSHMLNPLGKAFFKMKAYARRLLNDSNIGETNLVTIMETSIAQITQTDCCNYVMDVVLLLHDAIAGRPIESLG